MLSKELATSNLHTLVCRVPLQERDRGLLAFDVEMAFERHIGVMKEIADHSAKRDPEKFITNQLLLKQVWGHTE